MEKIYSILDFVIFHYKDHIITILDVLMILIIIFVTKIILWLIHKAINRQNKFNNLDSGTSFAVYQLIKYFVWIIAFVFILEALGIQITILLAGSAALLVGLGLGLQQTFNDIISGVILLVEQSVKVGDILDIDGDIVKIKEIGLRTSKGLNRHNIIIVIPNSLITTNKVINWSDQTKQSQFTIGVGVAYGTDVDLVCDLLIQSAQKHNDISQKNKVECRFTNFGNSSLDFELLFYSHNMFGIERVKSDIRKTINKLFIEHNISIPFPQMDVRIQK